MAKRGVAVIKCSFIDERSGEVVSGIVISRSTQPFTGEPITEVYVNRGFDKGMTYWVPTHVLRDGVLGVLARL